MKNILVFSALLICSAIADAQSLAFPEAEGFGKYTTGGRGGMVYIVSNLNDSGRGSFREAATASEPRIIVFSISGTIHLQSRLSIKDNVTIAGQSAPGDGICLADYPVSLNGNNIIVRYMRFRMGDKNQKGGMVDGNGGDDAFSGIGRKNIIIDHCSLSWSTDEAFSVYAGDSTTLQWNLIAEPLNYSYHFETGDTDYERHGFGGIWGGRHFSAHHNLFAHCNNRTPRFDGIRNSPSENVDFRNNVIYNWGGNNVYAGEGGNYNIVNNYYKYGPETGKNARSNVANPYKTAKIPFGKFFINGNYVDGFPKVSKNNWLGVKMEKGSEEDARLAKQQHAFAFGELLTQSSKKAYKKVLKHAGASLKRDTMDQRIVKDVKKRTGRFVDVQGGFRHGTEYEKTVNAWPVLTSLSPLNDVVLDGIPDEWEKTNKLNISADDSALYSIDKQYTNIEVYINSITK